MAEAKKRFPWWLVASAVVLVLFAVVAGFVETAGRQGTIVGRYQRIAAPSYYEALTDASRFNGMIPSESEVFAILGSSTDYHDFEVGYSEGELARTPETERNRFSILPSAMRGKVEPVTDMVYGMDKRVVRWQEGPVEVRMVFLNSVYARPPQRFLFCKDIQLKSERFSWWHLRRWAEQAWTASHGPRH